MTDTETAAATAGNAGPVTPDGAAIPEPGRLERWVYLNVAFGAALLGLPLFLASDAPVGGWLLAVGMLLLNRLGHALVLAMASGLPRTMAVGAAGLGMTLRVWLIALALFMVGAELKVGGMTIGAGEREVAVSAMILFLVLFTIDVGVRSIVELRRYRSVQAPDGPSSPEETTA